MIDPPSASFITEAELVAEIDRLLSTSDLLAEPAGSPAILKAIDLLDNYYAFIGEPTGHPAVVLRDGNVLVVEFGGR